MKNYHRDVKNIKELFNPETVCSFENEDNTWDLIVNKLKSAKQTA